MKRFSLLNIYDLREVDFFTGKKIPLAAGEGNECMRCGRFHAVVWEVLDNETGKRWKIGSGCGPKALGGWEPDKEEIKAAKKAMRERAEAKKQARIEAEAERIAAEVAALTEPPMEKVPLYLPGDPGAYKFVVGDSVAWVNTWDTQPIENRIRCARSGWVGNRISERTKNYDVKRAASTIYHKKYKANARTGGKRRHARASLASLNRSVRGLLR